MTHQPTQHPERIVVLYLTRVVPMRMAAWMRQSGISNVRPPLAVDVTDETWPIEHADAQ